MPQENVEIVRAAFRGWNERGIDGMLTSGDHVFNGVAINGRGRGSGVEVAMEFWQVWLVRGDRAARCEEYLTRSEALEAVGLSEQDAHADS